MEETPPWKPQFPQLNLSCLDLINDLGSSLCCFWISCELRIRLVGGLYSAEFVRFRTCVIRIETEKW
ncbi:hypothetical protein V6N13_070002 [Hibiscus sabdariffa]